MSIKTLKNGPEKLLIIGPNLFLSQFSPDHSTELIFHTMKSRDQTSVYLSVQSPCPFADVIYGWYLRDDKSPNGDVSDIPHPRKVENRCILKLFVTAYQSLSLYISMKYKDTVSIWQALDRNFVSTYAVSWFEMSW